MYFKKFDFPEKDLFISLFKENSFAVGGYVRDLVRGNPSTDVDILITNYPVEEIIEKLKSFGHIDLVGKSFGVIKFTQKGRTIDVSLPRIDLSVGSDSSSHKDFIIKADPYLPIEKDLQRRDIKCNSMALRLIDGKLIDPFNGRDDIKKKTIRMTDPSHFLEDPLRVLRVARFASVLNYKVSNEIYEISKKIKLKGLSSERISEELFKLLLNSKKPSIGMEEYLKLGVIDQLFPPILPMTYTIQDSIFHPEKDRHGNHTVWHHTLITLNQAKRITEIFKLERPVSLALLLGALFHDIAKPHTSQWEWKKRRLVLTNKRHDYVGTEITKNILNQLKIFSLDGYDLKEKILLLVKYHHRTTDLWQNRGSISKKAFNRLMKDMKGDLSLLIYLDLADRKGRENKLLRGLDKQAKWLFKKLEDFNVTKESIKPLVRGRDLLNLGFSPGPNLGKILKELWEMQLDGAFFTKDEGIEKAPEVCMKLFGKEII
ncbi:MAG: HD domain-containing protein [Acidobacteriota bacterium]